MERQFGRADEIWSSDLGRCVEAAECAAEYFGVPYQTDRRLREIDLGEWEGKTFRDIRREFPEEYRMRESTWELTIPRRRKISAR